MMRQLWMGLWAILATGMWSECATGTDYVDYYVNAQSGNDVPSGGTESSPWRTISFAITQVDAFSQIHIAPGLYNSALGESFPIQIPWAVSLQGAGIDQTLVNGDGIRDVIQFRRHAYTAETFLHDMTISFGVAGIYAEADDSIQAPKVRRVRLTQNAIGFKVFASDGGVNGIQLSHSEIDSNHIGVEINAVFLSTANAAVINTIIRDNHEGIRVSAFASNTVPLILNSTVAYNASVGIRNLNASAAPTVINSIFWQNPQDLQDIAGPAISFSDIQDGQYNDQNGNISVDPQFIDPTNRDLRLASSSPCIETGTNNVPGVIGSLDRAGYPRFNDGDLDGALNLDIGAHEFSNVSLEIEGVPAVGGSMTVKSRGLAGIPLILIVGFSEARLLLDPYGVLLVSPGPIPWRLLSWGIAPSDVVTQIPNEPSLHGLALYFQEIGLFSTLQLGNFSNRVKVTFQ